MSNSEPMNLDVPPIFFPTEEKHQKNPPIARPRTERGDRMPTTAAYSIPTAGREPLANSKFPDLIKQIEPYFPARAASLIADYADKLIPAGRDVEKAHDLAYADLANRQKISDEREAAYLEVVNTVQHDEEIALAPLNEQRQELAKEVESARFAAAAACCKVGVMAKDTTTEAEILAVQPMAPEKAAEILGVPFAVPKQGSTAKVMAFLGTGLLGTVSGVSVGLAAGVLDAKSLEYQTSKVVIAALAGVVFSSFIRYGLDRVQQSADLDFVQLALERMVRDVELGVTQLPAALADRLSPGEGKALDPLFRELSALRTDVVQVAKQVHDVVDGKVDPTNPRSAMAGALDRLQRLLDPDCTNSVEYRLRRTVESLAAQDGSLAQSVEAVVAKTLETQLKPVREQVGALHSQVVRDEAAAAVVQSTTLKGFDFEDAVEAQLQDLACAAGFSLDRVGGDNQAGDFVIDFSESGPFGVNLRIVVEAKDDQLGRGQQRIADTCNQAIARREANFGILVAKSEAALGRTVGSFAEGSGPNGRYVACTLPFLGIAIRYSLLLRRFDLAKERQNVDLTTAEAEVGRLRQSIAHLDRIQRAATKADEQIESIRASARAMRSEVQLAVSALDRSLSPAEQ